MNRNYDRELQTLIAQHSSEQKRLLLHSCCGPCSTYVLECLAEHFTIDLFFYNPNIAPPAEFEKRLDAQRLVLKKSGLERSVRLIVPPYTPQEFYEAAKGLEDQPEHGERCTACMKLRIDRTAQFAAENGYDYFCTTLSVSPHKNAELLHTLSEQASAHYGIDFLPADFKKRGGFLRSTVLSKEYGLYRQNYCGCVFSKPKA